MIWTIYVFLLTALVLASRGASPQNRTFAVDFENDTFLKDGQPFRYVSCTLHYFQIPYELWQDRMLRVRALGCNVLQTYIMWSMHQPWDNNSYVFQEEANVNEYLSMAHELGFLVVIRPGPFINAEMDFGGFPYWLLKKKDVVLRASHDDWYLQKVENWLNVLLPTIVKPQLYENGGPIILVQVENEYGADPNCDKEYLMRLRDLSRQHLGNDTVLITTDSNSAKDLGCGHVDGLLPTIDFGCLNKQDVQNSYSVLRKFLPRGPMVNSEFYPGWLDMWGNTKRNTTPLEANLATMRYMWDHNVTSFNIYPAHGGTNWGYIAGGKYEGYPPVYRGVMTAYDFDAPISEAGDTTPKFVPMRKLIEQLTNRKIPDPVPESPPKYGYGRVRMEWLGTIFHLMHSLTPANRVVQSKYPLTMEELDQPYGFVIYETTVAAVDGLMEVTAAHDRAYVVINGQLAQVIQRTNDNALNSTSVQLATFQGASANGTKIHILVENEGRICYGDKIKDPKGLLTNVTLDGQVLTNWTMYPIDLSLIHGLMKGGYNSSDRPMVSQSPRDQTNKYLPSVYFGHFFANASLGDTFFDTTNWGKGQMFINQRNIGRYWPLAGPQVTLYVPSVYLSQEETLNRMFVFELEQPGNCQEDDEVGCYASFIDKPILKD